MTTWQWIELAWTAFWVVFPFASFPIAVVLFARYILRRTSGEGFASEWIPLAADVAKLEADLPKMPGAVI